MAAKLTRFIQKVFGSSAGASEIGQFGSLAAGSPTTTTNPATIQALSNYLDGWFAAVIGANSPAIEDMNALHFLFARQLAYLFQQGVPEWEVGTEYFIGSLVNADGTLYMSTVDNNIGNAVTDTTKWAQTGGSSFIFPSVEALVQSAKLALEQPGTSIDDFITEPFIQIATDRVGLTNAIINITAKRLELDGVNTTGSIESQTHVQNIKALRPIIWSADYITPTRFDVDSGVSTTGTILTSTTTRNTEVYNGTTSFGWFVKMKRSSASYQWTQAMPGYRVSITNATGAGDITVTHSALPITLAAPSSTEKWVFVAENISPVQKSIAGAGYSTMTPTRIRIFDNTGIPFNAYVHANYKMDELSGDALNAAPSGSTYDLTENGSVPSGVGIINGARGPMSGGNFFKWASGGSSATPFDASTFMLEAWIKTTAVGSEIIMTKYNGANNGYQFGVNGGALVMSLGNGASLATYTSATAINDDMWHHVFWAQLDTTGTDQIRGYIDGVRDAGLDGTSVAFAPATNDFLVGVVYTEAGGEWSGLLDEVTYYDSTPGTSNWSAVEEIVAARYNGGIGAEYGSSNITNTLYGQLAGQSAAQGDRLGIKMGMRREVTTIDPYLTGYSVYFG